MFAKAILKRRIFDESDLALDIIRPPTLKNLGAFTRNMGFPPITKSISLE